ncbi:MAG: hypothetical protein A3G87_08370 [Omnitrophica bacterium RIFCSPLOWO2_12_FULL_50_11]|nr:MAG: hypothetical protein A3G87_08370 [Omnitrophica bacterium RIFCSPLOWO2_12_FULL_50_11]
MKTTYWRALICLGLVVGGALLSCGCAPKGYITASVQSMIGLDVSENPQTQVPHIRFGLLRNQFYYIPTGLSAEGATPGKATETPELVSTADMDIKFLSGTRVIEKFAVGPIAVKSTAAAIAFIPEGQPVPTAIFMEELSPVVREIRLLLQDPAKLATATKWIGGKFPNNPNQDNPDKFVDNPPEPAWRTLTDLLQALK